MGFVEAFGLVAVVTTTSVWGAESFGYPSPQLLRSLAEIGSALFLAYVLEAIWLVNRAERRVWHRNWIGFVAGIGLAGFVGVMSALATAAHLEAGHRNLLDDVGLWWAVQSLLLLGFLVAMQPIFADLVRE